MVLKYVLYTIENREIVTVTLGRADNPIRICASLRPPMGWDRFDGWFVMQNIHCMAKVPTGRQNICACKTQR